MLKYALYFLVGGAVVTLITLLAELGHPFLAGIAIVVPSVTLVSFYFIGKSSGAGAVVASAKSALMTTFVVWLPYMLSVIYLAPKLGVNRALLAAFGVFLAAAAAWIYLNRRLGLI